MSFATVGRDTVWRGSFLSVEELRVMPASGREFTRHVVRHPGAVAIVAVADDHAVLVDEHRVAVDRQLLQIPAGKLDVPGEAPFECAQRELAEEVGLEAEEWLLMSSFFTTPGFCDEVMHAYLAQGLREVTNAPVGAEEEAMTTVRVALADVPSWVVEGRIADAKTIAGLLLAREILGIRGGMGGEHEGGAPLRDQLDTERRRIVRPPIQ